MDQLLRFLLISAIVLFVVIFYRWLLRYLRKDDFSELFPYVYPFSKPVLTEQETLKFELPIPGRVVASLVDSTGQVALEVLDTELQKGTHETAFSLTGVEPGEYTLKIVFPNQTTSRKVRVG